MFYPGETDYHIFTLPFPSTDIASVLVSYKQRGRLILEKEAGGMEPVEDEVCRVYVSLSQEETLKFSDSDDISIQVNIMGAEGGRVTSVPIVVKCGEQFHRQVIDGA